MNLYDKSSLILVPGAVKDGKVYSQRPENGDGDFTFSRSTAATRVNADGLIEKETQNLLTYSNTFDNPDWIHAGITLTSGQSGYDGNSNAWKLDKIAAAYTSFHQDTSQSGVQTISVYAKEGTLDTAALYADGGTADYAVFDLTNGNNSAKTSGVIDAGSTDEGNGWYRLYMVVNKSVTRVRFYPDWSNSTAGNVYIQDFQLEQGLVARDYIETTTAAVEGGITDNVPRLDYTDSSCPALLLEPQRTNLVTYSEYAGSIYWSKSNSIITDNAATSPEGLDNAFELTDNTSNGYHWIYRSGVASVPDHRISFFAKANTLSQVWSNGGSGSNSAGFDLSNGTIAKESGNANAKIEDYGNGWYRCSFTSDANGVLIATMKNDDETYAGTGQSIYMYGIQSEQEASYATSYIPTYGTSVTFANDVCGGAGNASTFNSEEGVLYVEISALANDGTFRVIAINGTPTNVNEDRIQIYFRDTANIINFGIESGNSTQFFLQFPLDVKLNNKLALKYSASSCSFWINGLEVGEELNKVMPTGLSRLDFATQNGGDNFYGKTKQILYFPTALTDAELEALTQV